MIKMKNGIEATEAQYSSMVNLIERYKKEPDQTYIEFGHDALMCVFDGLTIGIEKDGYAHS
uniref:Uncharacterized protein n=1 Tax=viral metagenome TaxID=1070528 RepID=A0A6M3LW81_9ZZZZ